MQYTCRKRKNEALDSEKVTLQLNMGQVRKLEKLIDVTLSDIEEFGTSADDFITEKELQRLLDAFLALTMRDATPEEKEAEESRLRAFQQELEDIAVEIGFDPFEYEEAQS
jgi:hypothetical protein